MQVSDGCCLLIPTASSFLSVTIVVAVMTENVWWRNDTQGECNRTAEEKVFEDGHARIA